MDGSKLSASVPLESRRSSLLCMLSNATSPGTTVSAAPASSKASPRSATRSSPARSSSGISLPAASIRKLSSIGVTSKR
jgi:hypothetical protein